MSDKKFYRLAARLLFAIPAIFLTGTLVVLLTRYIFYLYHADYFVHHYPTISRAAAFAPSSYFFTCGILVTVLFIITSWLLGYFYRKHVIMEVAENRWLLRLNNIEVFLGVAAAIFLALLAIINSEMNGHLHEMFSIAFFSLQIAAFVMDTLMWKLLCSKGAIIQGTTEYRNGVRRIYIFVVLFIAAAIFLGLYLVSEFDLASGNALLKRAFFITEYTVAILCFAYALPYYSEIKKHYRKLADQAR